MKSLEENLRATESAMETQLIKPSKEEISALKTFCTVEIEKRQAAKTASEGLKQVKATIKTDKAALEAFLKASGSKCAMLSKEQMKRLELLTAAEGVPPPPPFVRVVTSNKDLTITPEVIREAIETVALEDVQEALKAGSSFHVAVQGAIMQNIRRAIRTYTEALRLSPSLERGKTTYDVVDVPDAMADVILRQWSAEQRAKTLCDERKAAVSATGMDKTQKIALETTIASYFMRTGSTSQRVVIDNTPYRVVKRTSVRKQRLGIGKLEPLVQEASAPVKSMEEFLEMRSGIVKELQVKLSSVPPETKTSISLCSIKQTASSKPQ